MQLLETCNKIVQFCTGCAIALNIFATIVPHVHDKIYSVTAHPWRVHAALSATIGVQCQKQGGCLEIIIEQMRIVSRSGALRDTCDHTMPWCRLRIP
jgi:hypothetical protein